MAEKLSGAVKPSSIEQAEHIDVNGVRAKRVVASGYDGTNLQDLLVLTSGQLRTVSQDYLLSIAEGDIANHTPFAKYGILDGLQNNLLDISQGVTNPYVFPATAGERMRVVSTSIQDGVAGSGATKIKIEYLNETGATLTEEVTMNGTTDVNTTATKIRRINKVYVSAGSNAVGNISVYHFTNATPIYGYIALGQTQSRQLIYTVPLGKTLYVTSVRYSVGVGNTTSSGKFNFVTFTNRVTIDPGTGQLASMFYPLNEIGLVNEAFVLPLEIPTKIPALADLKIQAIGDTALAVRAIVALRGWLE